MGAGQLPPRQVLICPWRTSKVTQYCSTFFSPAHLPSRDWGRLCCTLGGEVLRLFASDPSAVSTQGVSWTPSLEVLWSLAHLTICILNTGSSDSDDLWIHVGDAAREYCKSDINGIRWALTMCQAPSRAPCRHYFPWILTIKPQDGVLSSFYR